MKWIIGFPAGGAVDIVARIMAQVLFDNLPGALEQVRAGTMRGLGVTSPQR